MHISELSTRTIDDLETDIISSSQQINQQEFAFLLLVLEFDPGRVACARDGEPIFSITVQNG